MQHDESQRILLVEDNPADAQIIRAALEASPAARFTLVHVERLSDALTRLAEEPFAVVLLDLSLPDSWGFATISRIQERAPEIPIVVLTGLDDEEVAVKAVQEGAQDYLVKGQLSSSTLLRALQYAIERHRLRAAVRASEERYRNLFENASDAIVSFTFEGTITDVNRGLELMLGRTREELIGQHYRTLLTPASVGVAEERLRQLRTGAQSAALAPTVELEAVRKNGRVVPIEARDNILYNPQRKPVGILTLARDISARKALERQRLEFLAMLTHDIKNPLSVLMGYADYLLDMSAQRSGTQGDDVLPWIKSSALTILSLVNNYLDFARIEDHQLAISQEPVSLNDVLSRVGRQYEGEAQHRQISLELELQSLPWIEGDPLALDRVFTNLVYNALKFTPKQGRITISSTSRDQEVMVSITDTGPGIPSEELPFLFEKYRQAAGTRRKEGTGLGLFIVKTFVERHGGRVEVESTPGSGTCFRVVLPRKEK